jgi:hypothetical protein
MLLIFLCDFELYTPSKVCDFDTAGKKRSPVWVSVYVTEPARNGELA